MARQAGGARNYLTREQLLERMRADEADFEVVGGGVIRLRGLDPKDGLAALQSDVVSDQDRVLRICLAGISEPQMSPADLEALSASSLGSVNEIANRILELSGLSGEKVRAFLSPTRPSKESTPSA